MTDTNNNVDHEEDGPSDPDEDVDDNGSDNNISVTSSPVTAAIGSGQKRPLRVRPAP